MIVNQYLTGINENQENAMPPDSSSFIQILLDPSQWTIFNIIVGIFTLISAVAAVASFLLVYLPHRRQKKLQNLLKRDFGAELYSPDDIARSTRYYIRPDCSSINPSREKELREFKMSEGKLFERVEEFLSLDSPSRHLLLLADSGMGKTSFVLNYYAHNHNLPDKRHKRLAVVPLSHPEADRYIAEIKNPRDAILFLDAFDEDLKAIQDHQKRLQELMALCREFKRVLITCRTQFFARETEIPRETGIIRLGPYSGESGMYEFWALYLSPLNDTQVKRYMRKRYSFWRLHKRIKAFRLVKKVPLLSVRPMLLAYIPDLLKSEKTFDYTYQLYEEMVEAWVKREKGKLGVQKEPLRAFSERLAVDLYLNRERRRGERIPKAELVKLAKEWQIPLKNWQLTGRSLLNSDGQGNYKFAHRSIMEYLVVKQFISGENSWKEIIFSDQMQFFLNEIIKHHKRIVLRSKTLTMDVNAVKKMLHSLNFFDSDKNRSGKGIAHQYRRIKIKGEELVLDLATGLFWQQSGSNGEINHEEARAYIAELNTHTFAGYNDWRLPTLEEAMSLMKPKTSKDGFYVDAIFAKTQRWIWTADQSSASVAWVVSFGLGYCYYGVIGFINGYVRGVRSGQSSR